MADGSDKLSPMMIQYHSIKAQHLDALLLFRMGDFYELFYEDAIVAADVLGIALTKRGKSPGMDHPMCGVPVKAIDNYLNILIRQGFRVAVCEQVEDPAKAQKRGPKAIVSREVVRLLTPGTLTEESLLEPRRNNFLAALGSVRNDMSLAWVEITSGDMAVVSCPMTKLVSQISRIAPSEILVSDNLEESVVQLVNDTGSSITKLSPVHFDSVTAEKRFTELFEIRFLDAYGNFSRAELAALGALVSYLELTQKGQIPLLNPPVRERSTNTMHIDASTRRNLELVRNLSGNRENTLLAAIDKTLTAGGARLLESCVTSPLTDLEIISRRLDNVELFVNQENLRKRIRFELRKVPDISRALSRLCLNRGGPRDLSAIRNGLDQALIIHNLLSEESELPSALSRYLDELIAINNLVNVLETSLIDEPPPTINNGGFIAPGYDTALDHERKLRDDSRSIISGMQQDYVECSGISSLKIRYNNVLGYFIETHSRHAKTMMSSPNCEYFIHRQTLTNAIRFTSSLLSEVATKILNAEGRALEIEKDIFNSIVGMISDSAVEISACAKALATIDTAAALAETAVLGDWCRPVLESSRMFEISAGRHPVVENALKNESGSQFIANDCNFTEGDNGVMISLLTGPNMSGKSTYLRQNALIAILAQAGSFVPAKAARIGIVSSLFTRVGAADELASGRSTFMVEMVETAAILHQADECSLVILDEIGRGTATYDGLSIAWATLEYLHENVRCRTLFATHYHELTSLTDRLNRLRNLTVEVRECDGEVVFLHRVCIGSADRSYGVQVAKLAGIPPPVVKRANEILERLEGYGLTGTTRPSNLLDDLPLFFEPSQNDSRKPNAKSMLDLKIEEINPDGITPHQALNLLYELKELNRKQSSQ